MVLGVPVSSFIAGKPLTAAMAGFTVKSTAALIAILVVYTIAACGSAFVWQQLRVLKEAGIMVFYCSRYAYERSVFGVFG